MICMDVGSVLARVLLDAIVAFRFEDILPFWFLIARLWFDVLWDFGAI